jgi:hypothetical protein
MPPEITSAHLSILDGSWQETPDTIAILDQGATRGTLYLVVEVIGDAPDRDALARNMIESANREYGGSRGSITLALTQAVRAVNDFFYAHNVSQAREARCIAGITAAALRGDDLYIAQGGPGIVCLVHGAQLTRYPSASPWFVADEALGDFPTPGAVPIGLRRDYTPDLSYVKLVEGDTILVATRSLIQFFSDEELLDAVEQRSADGIVENVQDLMGSADLSLIAIQFGVVEAIAETAAIERSSAELLSDRLPKKQAPERIETVEEEPEPIIELQVAPPGPTPEEIEAMRLRAERRRAQRAKIKTGILGIAAVVTRGVAWIGSLINLTAIGNAVDRGLANFLWTIARLIRALVPGGQNRTALGAPKVQTAWQLAALLFPVLVAGLTTGAWIQYQRDQDRDRAVRFAQLMDQTSTAIKTADGLSKTDKIAAREYAQQALKLADQARKLDPGNAPARSIYSQAQEVLDQIDGVAFLLYVPTFADYGDPKAKPARIVVHLPDLFVLDRGVNRIYRYHMDEVGSSAQPISGDGSILKGGDRIGDRVVGELIDIMWIEAGRLVALDRNGSFWQYDSRGVWTARPAPDAAKWSRVNLATDSSNNLYLLDPSTNQILKYTQTGETWGASVPYFASGASPTLSAVSDIGADSDVWVLQKDGKVLRFSQGRPLEFTLRDLETRITNAAGMSVSSSSIYIADAGNQRVVQFERATGKFTRQFKPGGEYRSTFSALKTLAVDEAARKFFVIGGSTAYFANIPQP